MGDTTENLSRRILNFHDHLLRNHIENEWWSEVFSKKIDFISYYRKDSYLLADAPFALKLVMSIISPDLDANYYRTDIKGLKFLIDQKVVWLETLHPRKYKKCTVLKFINDLINEGKKPYYVDIFEESLATYWIHSYLDNDDTSSNIKSDLNKFKKNVRMPFIDFYLKK